MPDYYVQRGHGWQGWWRVNARDAARYAVIGRPVRLGEPPLGAVKRDVLEFAPHVPSEHRVNDRPLCRWCHGVCHGRRRTFCSDACVAAYQTIHDWGWVRAQVLKRDAGVCCLCGCDTQKARRAFRAAKYMGSIHSIDRGRQLAAVLRELRWPTSTNRDWWEADHIHARSEGGTNELDNLRTLCVPCHKARTAKQRKRWAAEKRDAEASLFTSGVSDDR